MPETLDLSTDDCVVEREGPVVVITMNRPEKRNALSPSMLVGLADAYGYVDATDDVRVAVLTGAGGAFSSGMDLVSMNQPRSEYVERRMTEEPTLHWKALLRDYRCSKPMIAAVEGYAVAGGTEMLQGTDIRVAGEGAIFGVWEAKRGLFPLGGSSCRLPRQIPYTVAMDILLTARPVTAEEARRVGLIGRVVPDGMALTVAMGVAGQVAECGPLSTKAILRAWRETEHLPDAEAMRRQDAIGWEVFASDDAKEGPRAFAEKRPPVFHGR
ncbi:MAG TPA: crotonase/enoyl-CoA hydratase family protein [Acidimicrobiia bacterium]|nr:crotonase/enoyl-CoA hydratase family protein [Acidimicrobiia bacterium]